MGLRLNSDDWKLVETLLKEEVFEAVKKYNGVGYTHSVAESYYERALAIIEELQMGKAKKLILTKLLNRAYNGLSK